MTVAMAALEELEDFRQRIIRHADEVFWMRADRAQVGQRGERCQTGRRDSRGF